MDATDCPELQALRDWTAAVCGAIDRSLHEKQVKQAEQEITTAARVWLEKHCGLPRDADALTAKQVLLAAHQAGDFERRQEIKALVSGPESRVAVYNYYGD